MKQVKPFNIVFCIDDNFAAHLAALLRSIVINTDPQNTYCFHVCSAVLSKQNQYKLNQAAGEAHTINYYEIDSRRFDNMPVSRFFANRMSAVTYFRLLVPELLHSVNGLALFMDADMIVNADIADLFSVNLSNAVAGVVEDSLIIETDYWRELGLPLNRYFNAGLMLIDLFAWRQNGITNAAMEMIDSGKTYKFNDQDILNLALKNQVEFLDLGWNVQQASLQKLKCANNAKVIHYNGAEKPWQFSCIHPFTELYRRFKAQTCYAEMPLIHFIDEHDRQLIDLIVQSKTSDVYIYGAGQKGRRIVCYLQTNLPAVNISGLIDRSPQMNAFNGIPVASVIPQSDEARVVVASSAYAEEIVRQLQQKQVPADSIIAVVDE